MNDHRQILDAYRKADAEKRLYLFLQCRALREQFVQVDLQEYHRRLQQAPASATKPARESVWRRMWAGFAFDKL